MPNQHSLSVDQLQVGLYIYLDLKWFEHPFAFSHFKIKSEDQIQTIRQLGVKTLRFSPELSERRPPAPAGATSAAFPPTPEAVAPAVNPTPEPSPVMLAKRAMMAQMQLRQQTAARIESAFVNTANTLRDIEKNMYVRPQETVLQATKLVKDIADAILIAPELAIHVMGDKMGGEELYFHSLNVTMLSIMMARDLKLPVDVAGALGLGALMHDIGRKEVPNKILLKTEALTQAERNFYELHCQFGVDIGQRLHLPPAALSIIREHHELYDGTGYPGKLKGESINLLARIVVIANYYDELCNPPALADALTPHEALSLMFAKYRGRGGTCQFDDS